MENTSILLEDGQLEKELFEHDYFFDHFTTGRGKLYRKSRIKIVKQYFERFDEVPTLAIENFFPEILLRNICNDSRIITHSQAVAEIQSFIDADTTGFFLQPEGRTNTYRGEFAPEFFKALKEDDQTLMFEILQKAHAVEHSFDKKF
jgi:hypothetical protein